MVLPFASNEPISHRMKALKQVGALCVCEADDETPLVLLVTSRDTGRWVIPKGWPAKRLKAHEAAAREAMEEAGVSGKIGTKPIGTYEYLRPHDHGDQLHHVSVYVVAARSALDHWPEESQRRRAWFSVSSAARRVAEPELRRLIRRIGTLSEHPKWRCISQLTKTTDRKPKRVRKSATGEPQMGQR
jgi:8-oxo-dGTP pyrophosphatase MutT (NUDIX family)